jgi:hypothetical protein
MVKKEIPETKTDLGHEAEQSASQKCFLHFVGRATTTHLDHPRAGRKLIFVSFLLTFDDVQSCTDVGKTFGVLPVLNLCFIGQFASNLPAGRRE